MVPVSPKSLCVTALVGLGLTASTPAHALQPLEAFLSRASQDNPDVRVARGTQVQREAEVDRATAPLLPSVQVQGIYTRNQYEVSFPASTFGGTGDLVITPLNQLDASLTITVPIVGIAFSSFSQTKGRSDRSSGSAPAPTLRA